LLAECFLASGEIHRCHGPGIVALEGVVYKGDGFSVE
jgi:hypothetical protein